MEIDESGLPLNGVGRVTYKNGGVYDGTYLDVQKTTGKYRWPDGAEYAGLFINNAMQGSGEFKWVNGQFYSGEWLNNLMHGFGCLSNEDGSKFEGTFANGLKEG